ncbi:RsfA family transcriptional regulator [Halobacillus sp. Marseille-Q1614]|uniref:RsfA family transcriptional regulator n=1 Tax=Halobacillus sp. Marseille-Q1614 TaxID=2709134 RepID=UPI00156FAB4C|nr:RsfA family transcriptional regulator [Halobacillus sp. Marseille-Q1614]
MPKVRQDAWSHEDDLLLAETVLRHIREGSTQLKAFDEVGDVLNRTSAACGFRWNAEIRQKYEQAVDLAKKQRKEKKRKEAAFQQPAVISSSAPKEEAAPVYKKKNERVEEKPSAPIDLPQVITFLENLQAASSSQPNLDERVQELEEENHELKAVNQKLQSQLQSLKEDYQAFISLMDRARKMTMFDDQEFKSHPLFGMEPNHLEHLAK